MRGGGWVSWSATIWAGFVASVLAACVFWLFRNLNLTQYSPTSVLGCIFHDEPRVPVTETVGLALYMLLGSPWWRRSTAS
jgi:asparagine N-glycosylation enzyme membrane subunit Stt3